MILCVKMAHERWKLKCTEGRNLTAKGKKCLVRLFAESNKINIQNSYMAVYRLIIKFSCKKSPLVTKNVAELFPFKNIWYDKVRQRFDES